MVEARNASQAADCARRLADALVLP